MEHPPGCRCTGMTLLLLALVSVLALAGSAAGQAGGPVPQLSWGGRLQGARLEGAAVDDAFASLYNPAALRACRTRQVGIQQLHPFGVPVTAGAWCAPTRSEDGTSVGWARGGHVVLRQSPSGLGFDYSAYQIAVAAAYSIPWAQGVLTFGATSKLLIVSVAGTGTEADETAAGYSLDGAIGYSRELTPFPFRKDRSGDPALFDRFTLDLSVVDGAGRLSYKSGAREAASTPVWRLSVALHGSRLTVAAHARRQDGHTSSAAGVQFVLFASPRDGGPLRELSLRAGIGPQGVSAGVGLGLLRGFSLDYAYRIGNSDHDDAQVLSTSWHF